MDANIIEDFDFSAARTVPKAGRRVKSMKPPIDLLKDDTEALTISDTSEQKSLANQPSVKKSVGGWGEETSNAIGHIFFGEMDGTDEKVSVVDADIPAIPEIENADEASHDCDATSTPSMLVKRIPTYAELENEILISHGLQMLDNTTDLTLLANFLDPKEDTGEEDEVWDWNRLRTTLAYD
ncbi:hypothetical protein EGR_01827 [Echinococcus granulosus]|uniref:Intraflagellar transport protein 43 n=1 Tax=Echinococcus granulosus TaxID=6210 RepID=W6URK7_ECHGR|nr:hypothetical protein EGR_01827 [Echinococcus granulosus]EUB63336.1 hypothetical protein EGR_01827 [Echinococcus granulosus]